MKENTPYPFNLELYEAAQRNVETALDEARKNFDDIIYEFNDMLKGRTDWRRFVGEHCSFYNKTDLFMCNDPILRPEFSDDGELMTISWYNNSADILLYSYEGGCTEEFPKKEFLQFCNDPEYYQKIDAREKELSRKKSESMREYRSRTKQHRYDLLYEEFKNQNLPYLTEKDIQNYSSIISELIFEECSIAFTDSDTHTFRLALGRERTTVGDPIIIMDIIVWGMQDKTPYADRRTTVTVTKDNMVLYNNSLSLKLLVDDIETISSDF